MAIRTRNLAELNQLAFDHLLRNTDGRVTLLSPGSVARALVETANRHLEAFYESLSTNLAMAFLSSASGPYLDLHGALFGLSRRPPRTANVLTADNGIRFYVATGTLYDRLPKAGDLNRGMIPAGTTVTNDDGSVTYTVEENVTFERTATEVFVPARATAVGSIANVGAFVLRRHSLPVTGVSVTNPISIVTGQAEENDIQFRSRISNTVLASQSANQTAIRLAALSSPGVAEVRIVPYLYGAGSFKLLVIPVGNRVPVETLTDVRQAVSSVVAFGIYFTVAEPKYRRLSMIISLRYRNGTVAGERNIVATNVERAVLNYVGSIPTGGDLVVTQLGAVIRAADDRVYDYSIDALCIDGKHTLLHNIRLGQDELFLPDTGLLDPIRII